MCPEGNDDELTAGPSRSTDGRWRPHERFESRREQVGRAVGDEHGGEDRRPAAQERECEPEREPDEAERPDLRQADEEPVEPGDTVAGDPVLELARRA